MAQQEFPVIAGEKYNDWCEKRILVCSEEEHRRRADEYARNRDLARSERDAFYVHELTGCEGFEFVVFATAKLERYVQFANGVVLVPCFSPEDGWKSRFIYDGWVSVETWDEEYVRLAVRKIDESLSIFSLVSGGKFDWTAKYHATIEDSGISHVEDKHIQGVEDIARCIDPLGSEDRSAIYRSLGWLSQGLRLDEPAARFLFSILAIESLARYIEHEAGDDSPLSRLRTENVIPSRRKEKRERCIEAVLENWNANPTKAVQDAYFECIVGIKRELNAHLTNIFGEANPIVDLLFGEQVEGKSLYDLRHDVAHGTADSLSEVQRDHIRQRTSESERIAHRYIWQVLRTVGFDSIVDLTTTMSVNLMQDGVSTREGIINRPTDMSTIYSSD